MNPDQNSTDKLTNNAPISVENELVAEEDVIPKFQSQMVGISIKTNNENVTNNEAVPEDEPKASIEDVMTKVCWTV